MGFFLQRTAPDEIQAVAPQLTEVLVAFKYRFDFYPGSWLRASFHRDTFTGGGSWARRDSVCVRCGWADCRYFKYRGTPY